MGLRRQFGLDALNQHLSPLVDLILRVEQRAALAGALRLEGLNLLLTRQFRLE